MNRTILAVAALVALSACSRQTVDEPVDAVPTAPTETADQAPVASRDAILTSAVETGAAGIVLIHDRKTGCQYFATGRGNTSGYTEFQPRYNDSNNTRCVTPARRLRQPTPLFVPTDPFATFETGASAITLLLDRETNCQYFATQQGNSSGYTSLRPRLNADGSVFCSRA